MTVPFTRFFIVRFLSAVLALVFLYGTASAAPGRTVLVLGDSLSSAYGIDMRSGWVHMLEQRLNEQRPGYKVVNASVSGDTTAGGAARLPRLLAEHKPAVVVVGLGGNDGLRGLSVEQAKKNLNGIISRARASGAKVLLLGIRLPPNYGTQYNERFQRMYADIAAEQRVPLVPFMLEGLTPDPAYLQRDGIHPTAQAQPRILENVWARLKEIL